MDCTHFLCPDALWWPCRWLLWGRVNLWFSHVLQSSDSGRRLFFRANLDGIIQVFIRLLQEQNSRETFIPDRCYLKKVTKGFCLTSMHEDVRYSPNGSMGLVL